MVSSYHTLHTMRIQVPLHVFEEEKKLHWPTIMLCVEPTHNIFFLSTIHDA